MSKSSYVDTVLKTYEDPDILKGDEIEKVAKQALALAEKAGKTFSNISTSLVYKRIKRLMKQGVWKLSDKPDIPPPQEPFITVEDEEPIEVPSEEEPAEESVEEPSEKPDKELPQTQLIKPPTEEPPEGDKEPPQITADNVTGTLNLFLGKLEKFTGWEGWKLTEEEAEQWSPSCAYMLNKYMPDFMALYIPEIMFAGLTLTVFGSKVALYKQAKEEKEKKEKVETKEEQSEKPEEETPTAPEKSRSEKEQPFREKVANQL